MYLGSRQRVCEARQHSSWRRHRASQSPDLAQPAYPLLGVSLFHCAPCLQLLWEGIDSCSFSNHKSYGNQKKKVYYIYQRQWFAIWDLQPLKGHHTYDLISLFQHLFRTTTNASPLVQTPSFSGMNSDLSGTMSSSSRYCRFLKMKKLLLKT